MDSRLTGPRFEISFAAEGYPDAFACAPNPPACLYGVGDVAALREGLAVVGARKATPYGESAAKLFAGMAARRGIPIISGGARGCDAAAHKAALDAGGLTVAFLGGGCDRLYPAENRALFQRIVDGGGAVVSEYPWAMPPKPYMFRMRNRLIAGLARATLIVEAGLPSGTFSTADEALAANRDVLVVPGSVFSPNSKGANRLLLEGAIPVVDEESFSGQLDAIFPLTAAEGVQMGFSTRGSDVVLTPLERFVYDAVRADPMRLEEVAEHAVADPRFAEMGLTEVVKAVVRLEGKGLVSRFPDGRFGCGK